MLICWCSLLPSVAQVTPMWSWSALCLGFSRMQLAFTILVPTGEREKLFRAKDFQFLCACKITWHALEFICPTSTLRDDRELHIHPNSVLFGEKPPKWSVHVPNAASCPINKAFLLLIYSIAFIGCSREFTYISIYFHFLLTRVVFNEVVQTAKYYMRDVTAVESSWLVELAPHFYKQAKVRQRK